MTPRSLIHSTIKIRDFKERFTGDQQPIPYVHLVGEALAPRVGEMVNDLCEWLRNQLELDPFLCDRHAIAAYYDGT